ncbi:cytochrome c biogenesis protein ResB [Tautonia sociabilis]|uniref:ResB-like domain-containing protein n=1 Tax=Tautonia sociabilis TaxID=2080755 RepID=A0A432MFP9_9BACT|nr:cytochrome c biogenesis protein ResB [Tautonia sociabilis]RUL84986.1 hypothetical protein TsocGM_19270 [Tautonia sociabilis]
MATVSKKPSSPPPKSSKGRKGESDRGGEGRLLRGINGIYRFLASLKLAIVSISLLAIVIFVGMLYERKFGNAALQKYFYQTSWFGLLLAMLGINILCAATIRFPWKKRQTGFVVTHAGLLVLLVGSWISFQTGDEGQVAMVEGETSSTLVRSTDYTIRVQATDPRAREDLEALLREIFMEVGQGHEHGAEAEGGDAQDAALHALQDRIVAVLQSRNPGPSELRSLAAEPALPARYRGELEELASRMTGETYTFPFFPGPRQWPRDRVEVLTRQDDPFELSVTAFLPSAIGKRIAEPVPGGVPMMKVSMELTPPNMISPMDPLQDRFVIDENRWITAGDLFKRKVTALGPVRLVFQYIDDSRSKEMPAREAVNDFLEVPDRGAVESARLHYEDDSGRTRTATYFPSTETWVMPDGSKVEGKTATLTGSTLTATYNLSGALNDPGIFDRLRSARFDVSAGGQGPSRPITLGSFLLAIVENTKDEQMPLAEFSVKRGDGPEVVHWAVPIPGAAMPPMSFSPTDQPNVYEPTEGLVRVSYYKPLEFSEDMQGLKGSIEVLAVGDHQLYYRTINAEGIQNAGELDLGEKAVAFGGANRAMQASFTVDDYLESAVPRFTYVYRELPVGQAGQGTPAARVKLSRRGQSEERWVLLSTTSTLKPNPGAVETFAFPRESYNVSFDVDRKELPFSLRLVDFRRRFDPGTRQPSHYESDVLLYDQERGIEGEKVTISMNEPLSHRGYTFYQSSFTPPTDSSGEFVSLFQVRYDPTWQIIYIGCLMVVIGTFLQFYMRAGIFTDGGKRERERAGRPEEPTPEEPLPPPGEDDDL